MDTPQQPPRRPNEARMIPMTPKTVGHDGGFSGYCSD
jgi:hypothetical protein